MSTPEITLNPYFCSVCGALKRETNHWRILGCITYEDGVRKLQLMDWSESELNEAKLMVPPIEVAVACGDADTLTLISRFLETGHFDPPALRSDPVQKVSVANGC